MLTPVSDDASSPDAATRLIDALRDEAKTIDSGRFSIDATAAAERMSRFRYANLDEYLLPIIEGLRALGASGVQVRSRAGGIEVTAAGASMPGASKHLRALFAAPFDRAVTDADYGRARLAVGVDMALAHDTVHRVAIEVRGPAGGHLAVFRGDREGEVAELGADAPVIRVVLDRPLIAMVGERPELAIASAATRWAGRRRPVVVISRALTTAPIQSASEALPSFEHQAERAGAGLRLRAGIGPAVPDADCGRLVVLSRGVICGEYDVPEIPDSRFWAFAELARPARDLSGMTLRRDDAFEQMSAATLELARSMPLRRQPVVEPLQAAPSVEFSWRRLATGVGLALLPLATGLTAELLDPVRMAVDAREWRDTEARIDDIELVRIDTYRYEIRVDYTYVAGAEAQIGDGVPPWGRDLNLVRARRALKEHGASPTVKVWVDPGDPWNSTVDTDTPTAPLAAAGIAALILGGASGWLMSIGMGMTGWPLRATFALFAALVMLGVAYLLA
jgi:hypothetical protein